MREIAQMTPIDPWFLHQLKEIADDAGGAEQSAERSTVRDRLREIKRMGFSDARLAKSGDMRRTAAPRPRRCVSFASSMGVTPVFKRVDTCAAEFESYHAVSLFDLRGRRRGDADRSQEGHDSGQRARTASGRELSSITAAATRRSR